MARRHRLGPPAARHPSVLLSRLAAASALVCATALSGTAQSGDGVTTPAASDVRSQPAQVTRLRNGTAHDALYDVALEGERGIAVGALGSVLVTTDGGFNWQAQDFPIKHLALLSVAMREGKCIAVGQTGLIYAADDCNTWHGAPSATKSRLLAVGLNKQGVAYAVGAFGTILRSTDWGKSWTPQEVDWKSFTEDGAEPHLYDVHVGDDGVVTAVGEFELVLRSKDGKEWKALHKGERSLFGLFVVDGRHLFATGQSGALLSSDDDGLSWKSHKTGTEAILTSVYATAQGDVAASGINAFVVSRDGGESWLALSPQLGRNAWYQALASSASTNGKPRLVAVGGGGSILGIEL
jgi:photosystem II stability/assembly factor-like uncharacterized protein